MLWNMLVQNNDFSVIFSFCETFSKPESAQICILVLIKIVHQK